MVLVQSILFFVLGAALSAFLLALFVPLAWRRALYFAEKDVRSQIPLSLNEVEASHDFARASHALELCLMEEKIEASRATETAARLAADRAKEQITYLAPFEQEAALLAEEVKRQRLNIIKLQDGEAALAYKMNKMEAHIAQDAVHLARLKARAAQVKILKKERARLRRQLNAQAKQIAQYQENMLANKDSQEIEPNNMHEDLSPLRGEIKTIAAQIVASVAREEGEQSPIIKLIEDAPDDVSPDNAPSSYDTSLAAAISRAIVSAK